MLVRITNSEDPDQTSLIWVCTVCLCLFGWRQLFEILDHLQYVLLNFEHFSYSFHK